MLGCVASLADRGPLGLLEPHLFLLDSHIQ